MFRKMYAYCFHVMSGILKKQVTEENIEELYEPRFRRICKEKNIPFIPFVFTKSSKELFCNDKHDDLDNRYLDICKSIYTNLSHNGSGFFI